MKTQLIVAAILWLAASNTVWSTEEEHNKNEIDFSIKTSACQSFSLRPHNLVDGAAVSYFYLAETPAGRIGDGLPPPCGGDKAAATTFSIRITARRGQQVTIICPRGCNVNIDCNEDSGGGRNDSFCKMIVYFLAYIALLLMLLVAITGSHCLHERRGARHCREADASEIPIIKTSEEKPTLKNESFNENKSINKDKFILKNEPFNENESTNENKPINEDKSILKDELINKDKSTRKDKLFSENESIHEDNLTSENVSTLENELNPENETVSENKPAAQQFDSSRSSISLLDRFRVRGSDGSDITANFSPLLSDMLMVLILHSAESGKGISVKQFSDIFWFDKGETDARNNRNANLCKLRKKLESVGDVRIENQNGYLRILFGSGVTCDYHAMAAIVQEYDRGGHGGDSAPAGLLARLLLRGPLLADIETDWADPFKGSYSSRCLDLLLPMLQRAERCDDCGAMKRIVDVIFRHDPLNEQALAARCAMLARHGKMSIAKNVYDRFCDIYRQMMDEKHDKTFGFYIN